MLFKMTTVDPARRLNLAQPVVSQVVIRDRKVAENQQVSQIEKTNQYSNGRPVKPRTK
jgi:hypothetical protein